jgi:nuclear pore complex protein Nup188
MLYAPSFGLSIFDVASLCFPVHVKPLLRLLRAMTGVGFLDNITAVYVQDEDRYLCDRFVYHYLIKLLSDRE